MDWYYIVLIVLGGILVLFTIIMLIASYMAFKMYFVRKEAYVIHEEPEKAEAANYGYIQMRYEVGKYLLTLPHKELDIISFDGLKLTGTYFDNKSDKTVICVHGFHSTGFNDMSVFAKEMLDRGYNALIIYQRAHNFSEGKYITYGTYEKYDLKDWVNKINDLYKPKEIILCGLSMGCSTVELASSIGLAENVKALILDCGYTNTFDEMCHGCRQYMHIPPWPLVPLSNMWTKLLVKISMKDDYCYKSLENDIIPALFIHGKADKLVPFEHGLKNYEHCSSYKEYLWFDDCDHAESIFKHKDEYMAKVDEFLKNVEEQNA